MRLLHGNSICRADSPYRANITLVRFGAHQICQQDAILTSQEVGNLSDLGNVPIYYNVVTRSRAVENCEDEARPEAQSTLTEHEYLGRLMALVDREYHVSVKA